MSDFVNGTGNMSTPIQIFTRTPGRGVSSHSDSSPRDVWADVFLVGVRTRTAMLSVGKTVELSAVIWKESYQKETHAIVDGVTYKIESVLPAKDKLRVKLMLSRG